MTNVFHLIRDEVGAALDRLAAAGEIPAGLPRSTFTVEPTRDPAHGEAATNAAMVLARPAGMRPLDLARKLAAALGEAPMIAGVGAAPPGFVNMTLAPELWRRQVAVIHAAGRDYGRGTLGEGRTINVEFCSANPTGPLHVGHGRGTVFGDALASVLAFAGWDVTREYYVNDGGAQIETLARSLHHRYLEVLGREPGPLPEGSYPGLYLKAAAAGIAQADGACWADVPETAWLEEFSRRGVAAMMALIRDDLAALGVQHDVFTSERALIEAGRIDEVLGLLETRGLVYEGTLPPPKGKVGEDWEPLPQLLFRTTAYGDDVDRPLKRSNGSWAYIAPDVAYHWDKVRRGFHTMVDVLGADHGGYVKRLQASVRALSEDRARLDVRLCQLVNLMDGGRPLKMSKRAGRIVTLRDVIDEVGRDVVRFIMLTRKNDAPLDFDLAKVTEQSRDNPVFYVQYAHARVASVFRRQALEGPAGVDVDPATAALERLVDPAELAVIRALASFPRVAEAAAQSLEPHRIAFYLQDLASALHGLWSRGNEDPGLRFLRDDDLELTGARLVLLGAVRTVLATGLGLLGVEPLDELR